MKISIRILALGAILTSPLALAMPSVVDGSPAQVVKYNDLNLQTTAGAQQLYARLKTASWRVCREVVSTAGAPGMIERGQCAADLLDGAVKDVNKPVLTALHQGRPVDLTASR